MQQYKGVSTVKLLLILILSKCFNQFSNVENKQFNLDKLQFYISTKRARKICFDKTHTM